MVSVLVKRKDRKVKFDKDDDRLSVKAFDAARKKAFEDAQQQPPGTLSTTTDDGRVEPDGLPGSPANSLSWGSPAVRPMQVVTGDSAQGQAILAAMGQAGMTPTSSTGGPTRPAHVAARARPAHRG